MYKKKFLIITLVLVSLGWGATVSAQATLEELLSYPYPSHLSTAPSSNTLAWTFSQEGRRNIYISEDAGKTYRALTQDNKDDGQPLSNLQLSPDGKWLIYMKGGEPGGNWSKSESTPKSR